MCMFKNNRIYIPVEGVDSVMADVSVRGFLFTSSPSSWAWSVVMSPEVVVNFTDTV